MKKSKLLYSGVSIFFFITLLLSQYGCKIEVNEPPTCTITFPANESKISLGETVIIKVEAEDADGEVSEVRFEIDQVGVKIGDTPPFTYEWNTKSLELGDHTIKAIATDNDGESTEDEITVSLIIESGIVTDYDGNVYPTVKMGDQWWMAENLKTTHYADGTPLVDGSAAGYISVDNSIKYYFAYSNDESLVSTYGRLYPWVTVMNNEFSSIANPSGVQGIAPDGWHIPSDAEWKELEIFLGLSQSQVDDFWWRGLDEGGMLKEAGTSKWVSPNEGATNVTGYTAIPSGRRESDGTFNYLYYNAYFWSTSNYGSSSVWYRSLSFEYSRIYREYTYLSNSLSVRCVKN